MVSRVGPELAADDRLRFAVLGRLRVDRDGREIDPGPRLQRTLLAILVVEAGHVVAAPAGGDAVGTRRFETGRCRQDTGLADVGQFPTAVVGEHGGSPAAAVLYATSVVLASMASAASWLYASGRGNLLRPDAGSAQVRALRARSLASPLFFALTLPLAVSAPYVAEIMWVLIFPLTRIVFVWFFSDENEQPG